MKLLHKIIRAIERNSRANERRKLLDELGELDDTVMYAKRRTPVIIARLSVLGKADSEAYLNRNRPVKSVSQQIQEDDSGVPDGLVGEWKAPV